MQNIKKYPLSAIAIIVAFCAVILFVGIAIASPALSNAEVTNPGSQKILGSAEYNYLNSIFSTSTLVSNSASTLVLASSTGRLYARITNDDASARLYLGFGVPAVKGVGVMIPALGSYTIELNNMYFGAIFAIASSTSAASSTGIQGTRY